MTADEKADIINKWIDYAWEIELYPEIPKLPYVTIFYLRNCRKFIATSKLYFLPELEEMHLRGMLDRSKLSDSADGALDLWIKRWSVGLDLDFPEISEMQMKLAIAGKTENEQCECDSSR